jgi:hypothetical protein
MPNTPNDQTSAPDTYQCPYCAKEWPSPANRRADRPLNQDAVKVANKEVWSKCSKRLGTDPATGKGRKLTMNSKDQWCRRVWMDAYLAALEPQKREKPPDDPIDKCPHATTGNLIVNVINASDKKPVSSADVHVSGGADVSKPDERTGTTSSKGVVLFQNLKTGNYNVTAIKGKKQKGSCSARVEPEKTNTVKITLEKSKTVPVQWIEKTLEYHSGMHGKIVTKTKIIIREKYKVVPEDWVEYGQEWDEKEREPLPAGDVYYIRRYTAVFKTPDGLYYSEKVGKIGIFIFNLITFNLEGEAKFVYKSWDKYPKKDDDPLEKYRP